MRMLYFGTWIFLCAFVSQSVSGGLLLQDLTLYDKNGVNICALSEDQEICRVKSHQLVTLSFNLTVDTFTSDQSLNLYLDDYPILKNAEMCYDLILEKVEVVTFDPFFCFLPKSEDPYSVEVTFFLPRNKEGKLTLDVGSSKASLDVSVSGGYNSDASSENYSLEKSDEFLSTDECPESKEAEMSVAAVRSVKIIQDFEGPVIVNGGGIHVKSPSLLDENGEETCQTLSGNQLCTVYPNKKMNLRFNLTLGHTIIRRQFSLYLGNATILSDARVCYDFDSKNVFIQTEETKEVCDTSINPSNTPFLVEVPFEVPPFEGEELVFYIGSSRALLAIQSGSDIQSRPARKPSSHKKCKPSTELPETTTTTEQPSTTSSEIPEIITPPETYPAVSPSNPPPSYKPPSPPSWQILQPTSPPSNPPAYKPPPHNPPAWQKPPSGGSPPNSGKPPNWGHPPNSGKPPTWSWQGGR